MKKSEKLIPLIAIGSVAFFEGEATGGVENDGFVGEPPITVTSSAEAGKRFGTDGKLKP